MTDFDISAGREFDRAIVRTHRIPVLAIFVFLAAVYFSTHIAVWIHHGHPVVKDAYRASHKDLWLVDRDAVRIRTK